MASQENMSRRDFYIQKYQETLAALPDTFRTQDERKQAVTKLSDYYANCLREDLKDWVRARGGDIWDIPMALHEFKKKAEATFSDYPELQKITQLGALVADIRQREVVKRKTQNDMAKERVEHLANNTVLGTIMKQVQDGLSSFDKTTLQRRLDFMLHNFDAIRKIRQEASASGNGKRSASEYKTRIDELGLSNSTYELLISNTRDRVIEMVTRSAEDTAMKRNFKIAEQLEKIGVTNVQRSECTHSNDGFDGYFSVDTPQGSKAIYINTIVAGGWNIQERHLRVLVNVKDVNPAVSTHLEPRLLSQLQQVILDHIESTPTGQVSAQSVSQLLSSVKEMVGTIEGKQIDYCLSHVPTSQLAGLANEPESERLDKLLQLFSKIPAPFTQKPENAPIAEIETPALSPTNKPRIG